MKKIITTIEEVKAFKKELNELLNKYDLYFDIDDPYCCPPTLIKNDGTMKDPSYNVEIYINNGTIIELKDY